jgi:hypothetical protein
MHMKHRRQGHINIITAEPAGGAFDEPKCRCQVQRMQHKLPVREIDPFGITCCTCRIKSRGDGIFIEIGEVKIR